MLVRLGSLLMALSLAACAPAPNDAPRSAIEYSAFSNWLAHSLSTAASIREEQNLLQLAHLAEALLSLEPAELDAMLSEDFVQHNPMLEDGKAGLLALASSGEGPRGGGDNLMSQTSHLLSDGDKVVIHRRGKLGPLSSVTFDVLQFDEDGKLSEYWNYQQPIEGSLWDNLMFSFVVPRQLDLIPTRELVPGELTADMAKYALPVAVVADEVESNKETVQAYLTTLYDGGDVASLRPFLAENFYLRQPGLQAGRENWLQLRENARKRPKPSVIERILGQNDLVWVLSRIPEIRDEDVPELAAADLFRVREGLIVEQWRVVQPSPRFARNTNGLF